MTCISRSASARTGGTPSGSESSTRVPRSRKSSEVVATAFSTRARMSTSALCHSARPNSILAMSSTWLTSLPSRSLSETTICRNFARWAASISGASSISSERARMEVSGVRSSWVTEETKSSLSWSRLFSCSFAARSSAVATSSEVDFSSRARA